MIASCLPDIYEGFKKKIRIFSIIYITLQYLTAFDSSVGIFIATKYTKVVFLRVLNAVGGQDL